MRIDKRLGAEQDRAGVRVMATAAEYRNWAEDYFKWAREAPDANVRVASVKMAQLWLECAHQNPHASLGDARASDCRPRAKVQDSSLKLV